VDRDARPLAPTATLALIVCAALFMWASSRQLPALVAAHFDSTGRVTGHMPRGLYVGLMLVITIVIPLLLAVIPSLALRTPGVRINLPNREYWLAPERRAATIAFLSRQMSLLACVVVVFLCYMQWQVVRANRLAPPMLESRALLNGVMLFVGATLCWTVWLIGRFRRLP
jgi:uncharacterized membrane protein